MQTAAPTALLALHLNPDDATGERDDCEYALLWLVADAHSFLGAALAAHQRMAALLSASRHRCGLGCAVEYSPMPPEVRTGAECAFDAYPDETEPAAWPSRDAYAAWHSQLHETGLAIVPPAAAQRIWEQADRDRLQRCWWRIEGIVADTSEAWLRFGAVTQRCGVRLACPKILPDEWAAIGRSN